MRRIFTVALLFSSSLTPVFANDIALDSRVGDVTVYPQGAEVTRLASGAVPQGDHVIIIDDLPGRVVANSVRVEGSSSGTMASGSVDVRQIYVSKNDNPVERIKIEEEIESLSDQLAMLDQQISNAKMQRSLLRGLAGQALLPRRSNDKTIMISAGELGELFSLTGGKLAELSAITEKARIDKRSVMREIAKQQQQLALLSPNQELKTVVAINLTSGAQSNAEFRIRYKVNEAGWTPVYDAKLTIGKKGASNTVKLVRRASVRQTTTDQWDDIRLTLSTARARGSTHAPVLSPYVLSELRVIRQDKRKRRLVGKIAPSSMQDRGEGEIDALASPVAPMEEAVRNNVAVEYAGFLAEYKIPGMVSISNAGAEKNVVIGEKEFAAEISAHAVPKFDPTAYLTAEFTLKSDAPYLPGAVLLSRDGIYLGRGHLPLLNSGEKHALGFGSDDFIKIKRSKVTSKTGESGFISTVNVEERKFITTIKNLHDFPMLVIVEDNLPYSTHEDIEVEMLSGLTRPSKQDIDNKRGVLSWDYLIEGDGEKQINFGYKVSWPKEMQITPVR